MLSFTVGCGMTCWDCEKSKGSVDVFKSACQAMNVTDICLTIIFGVIAGLGLANIIPRPVGVAFCVLATVEGFATVIVLGKMHPYHQEQEL